jgi:bifunctional non-homologous end joining protein LigD
MDAHAKVVSLAEAYCESKATSSPSRNMVNFLFSRRRELLESLLTAADDPRRVSPLVRAPSGQVFEAVRKLGLEGVVGKRIDSIYEPARIRRVDQAPHQPRAGVCHWRLHPGAHGFDALLVGVYEDKELIFVAKVKNGFVPRIRDELFPALKALQTVQCPFRNLPEKRASR